MAKRLCPTISLGITLIAAIAGQQVAEAQPSRYYFPPPGDSLDKQDRRRPDEVGLASNTVEVLRKSVQNSIPGRSARWALWRHGYLVHVEGDFNQTVDVASQRKTWHALIVGAAIKQGKIPSLQQKLSVWQRELRGNDADATWWHVLTQSAGFDYPYGDYPDYKPGEMWTYSDLNLVHLCHALAKVYGKKDFHDHYPDVAREAYFDAIGMKGWSTKIVVDSHSKMEDGVRFCLSLEHMGRLGLLVLARGTWNGRELIPRWFVEELETKQTKGMRVNYDGPNDGRLGPSERRFREMPYGYLTWVNSDGDLFPGADKAWACAAGAGGNVVLWDHRYGTVFACTGAKPGSGNIACLLEKCMTGVNPLARP